MKKMLACILALCMICSLAAWTPAAAEDVVTVTLVRTGTPEVLHGIFEPLIEKFEAEHPKMMVNMQDLGWSDATQSVQTWAASDTLPDVMYHLPATVFDLYEKGKVLDLTGYVDDALKEDIYPAMLEAGQYDGKQLMIPCGGSSLIMWYNAELFRQAGLDPENPPQNLGRVAGCLQGTERH